MSYDIFISHRASNGGDFSGRLSDRLKTPSKVGERVYTPFLAENKESMHPGPFPPQLYQKIEECPNFILILSPGALSRHNHSGFYRYEA